MAAAQVWAAGQVVNALSRDPSADVLTLSILALVATVTVVALDQIRADQQRLLGERCGRTTTHQIGELSAAQPLIRFDDPAFTDRIERAQIESMIRPPQVTGALLALVASGSTLVGLGAVLISASPIIGVLALLAACPLVAASVIGSRLNYAFTVSQTATDRRRAYFYSLLVQRSAAAELRAYELGPDLLRRHDSLYDQRLVELRRMTRRRVGMTIAGVAGASLGLGAVLVVLVSQLRDGRLPLGSAVAAVGALLLAVVRLAPIAAAIAILRESALFLSDIESLLSDPAVTSTLAVAATPSTGGRSSPIDGTRNGGAGIEGPGPDLSMRDSSIRLDRVTFTYPGRTQPAISDITLELQPGEIVALVGENGAGKSTLVKCLVGLLTPHSGTISWNGRDPEHDPVAWRRQFAVVFQEHLRPLITAREAIAWGDTTHAIDDARADAAATAGGASFARQLPDGLDTLLGPQFFGGTDLSGGQWQRLALARALYRDAPFVVLDEPTASLDPRAEVELFADVRAMLHGRGAVLVTHRFSSCRAADRICVLIDGRIAEIGTHHQLIQAGALYAELFDLQASTYLDHPDGSASDRSHNHRLEATR